MQTKTDYGNVVRFFAFNPPLHKGDEGTVEGTCLPCIREAYIVDFFLKNY